MSIARRMNRFTETRPQQQFQERLQTAMDREGLDTLILTTPENITYATGWVPNLLTSRQIGASLAVVPKTGKVAAIVSQFEQGAPVQQTKDVDIIPYSCWIFIEDFYDPNEKAKEVQPDLFRTFRMAAELAKERSGKDCPKIGIELETMTADKLEFLRETFGSENLVNIDPFMIKVRTIKLPWELDVIRYAARVAEKMMNITMIMTEAGMTEADLFKIWHQTAYEITGGHDLCRVSQAHTPGPDFWATTLPRERELVDGDVVRIDGGVNIYGYISDLGRCYAVGSAVTPDRQAIFDTLLAAHDAEAAQLYPGNQFKNAFKAAIEVCHKGALPQLVRGHFGHTLGMGPSEEYPMLDPNNEMVFKPGMVFCVETPYYSSKFGSYNIEDEFIITENGCERITHTNRSLFVGMK